MGIKRIFFTAAFVSLSLLALAQIKMNEATLNSGIEFSTDFESGSLDSVSIKSMIMVSAQMQTPYEMVEFDLFSRLDPPNPADPNLPSSARWYFFKMKGVKNKVVRINMHNSDTRRPFYSYNGEDYTRFTQEECAEKNSITKRYENDSVFIAYFIPYPQSYLNNRINDWSKRNCVKITSIGTSEMGRNMPLLSITDYTVADKAKKTVYIHGRIHTSEAPASWHLDNMIEYLSGDTQYAKDLRRGTIFYILPFTNPDGVQEGMSRSNSTGINLEVNWNYSDSLTAKEIKNIKSLLNTLTSNGKHLDLALNMHSQSLNQVTYWVHNAESTSAEYYKNQMLFANLTINDNPYFRKDDLKFSKHSSKYVEGWFWDNFKGKTIAITFETPYTFYNNKSDGEWVSLENLKAQALNSIYAIGDYLQIPSEERIIVKEPSTGKKFRKSTDLQHIYYGDSYLTAKEYGAKVKYRIKSLQAGKYDIYKWNTGKNETVSPQGINEWIKIGSCKQPQTGKFVYEYNAVGPGDKADNILLIKQE